MARRKKHSSPLISAREMSELIEFSARRKRGRPKGSKSKKYGPVYVPELAGKRGRGRPKGSKSRKYGPVYVPELAGVGPHGKRRRGRPRGRKRASAFLMPLKAGRHKVSIDGVITIKD